MMPDFGQVFDYKVTLDNAFKVIAVLYIASRSLLHRYSSNQENTNKIAENFKENSKRLDMHQALLDGLAEADAKARIYEAKNEQVLTNMKEQLQRLETRYQSLSEDRTRRDQRRGD